MCADATAASDRLRSQILVVRARTTSGVTQVMISYGSLMSQVLQCTQLAALICRRLPEGLAVSATIS